MPTKEKCFVCKKGNDARHTREHRQSRASVQLTDSLNGSHFCYFYIVLHIFNPLPDMATSDSSSSTANKDMMSNTWRNGDTDI